MPQPRHLVTTNPYPGVRNVSYIARGPHKSQDTGQPLGPCWTFPEMDGAVGTAQQLTAKLGQDWAVKWFLPPDNKKDVRKWVNDLNLDPTCADAWGEAGTRFQTEAKSKFLKVKPAESLPSSFAWDPLD